MRKLERIETDKSLCDSILPRFVDISECEDDVGFRFSFDMGDGATLAISQLQDIAKPCDCGDCVKPKVCRFCFSDGVLECYVTNVICTIKPTTGQVSCEISCRIIKR
jgi:hypothetical protein